MLSLNDILNRFIGTLVAGYGAVQPAAIGVAWTMGMLAVFLVGYGVWSGKENVHSVIGNVFFLGFWSWFMGNWPVTTNWFLNLMLRAGLAVGGSPGQIRLLKDPDYLFGAGTKIALPMIKKAFQLEGDDSTLTQVYKVLSTAADPVGQATLTVYVIAILLVMLAYMVAAGTVFLALIEYYIVMSGGSVLLGFGFLKHGRFVSEKAIAGVVNSGLKLLVLGCCVGLISPSVDQMLTPTPPGGFFVLDALRTVFIAGVQAWLVWDAPKMAARFFGSSDQSIGHVVAAAVSLGGLVPGVSKTASMAMQIKDATREGTREGFKLAMKDMERERRGKGLADAARMDNPAETKVDDAAE